MVAHGKEETLDTVPSANESAESGLSLLNGNEGPWLRYCCWPIFSRSSSETPLGNPNSQEKDSNQQIAKNSFRAHEDSQAGTLSGFRIVQNRTVFVLRNL